MHKYFKWIAALLGLAFAVSLVACSEEEVTATAPDGTPVAVLPEDTFVLVLKDMHIVQAGVDHTVDNPKERTEEYRQYNKLVLDRMNIAPDRFYASYKHYQRQPEVLDSIYVRVIEQLNVEISGYQKGGNPNFQPPAGGSTKPPRRPSLGGIPKKNQE